MVSAGFATLLKERRASYNGQVAAARSRMPAFDTAAFSSFLRETVDPLFCAVTEVAPDKPAWVADALFAMAVDLAEHGWIGAAERGSIVERLWGDAGRHLAGAIAAEPRETLGALTNAAIKLGQEPGVRLDEWLGLLAELGGDIGDRAQLRALATLLAWRSGAAHARPSALAAADTLPPALACRAVGAKDGDDWAEIGKRLRAEPWWAPGGKAARAHRVGGFRGFGGSFAEPPKVAAHGGDFVAASGDGRYRLIADAFGATVRRSVFDGPIDGAPDPQGMRRLSGTLLHADDRAIELDGPAEGLAVVESAGSLAVSSPFSHFVRIYPKVLS
jgi:hypothetical protein